MFICTLVQRWVNDTAHLQSVKKKIAAFIQIKRVRRIKFASRKNWIKMRHSAMYMLYSASILCSIFLFIDQWRFCCQVLSRSFVQSSTSFRSRANFLCAFRFASTPASSTSHCTKMSYRSWSYIMNEDAMIGSGGEGRARGKRHFSTYFLLFSLFMHHEWWWAFFRTCFA